MATSTDINEIEYVSSFKRGTALSIDMLIVMFFSVVVAQILGTLWINNVIEKFVIDFREHFGTEVISNNTEHLEFIVAHPAFKQMIVFYFLVIMVGLLYHSLLNASRWEATIGKRAMNIKIVKDDYSKINFGIALLHYILSILPVVYILCIFALMINNHLTLFHAITHSTLTMLLGFAAILWVQIHSFTKRKTTAYDLICKVVFIHGKTAAKLPWSKN